MKVEYSGAGTFPGRLIIYGETIEEKTLLRMFAEWPLICKKNMELKAGCGGSVGGDKRWGEDEVYMGIDWIEK